jgi:hypothetical protein
VCRGYDEENMETRSVDNLGMNSVNKTLRSKLFPTGILIIQVKKTLLFCKPTALAVSLPQDASSVNIHQKESILMAGFF